MLWGCKALRTVWGYSWPWCYIQTQLFELPSSVQSRKWFLQIAYSCSDWKERKACSKCVATSCEWHECRQRGEESLVERMHFMHTFFIPNNNNKVLSLLANSVNRQEWCLLVTYVHVQSFGCNSKSITFNWKGLVTLQSEDRIQGSYPSQLCSAWQVHSEWLHAQWTFEDIQRETQAAWEFDKLMNQHLQEKEKINIWEM